MTSVVQPTSDKNTSEVMFKEWSYGEISCFQGKTNEEKDSKRINLLNLLQVLITRPGRGLKHGTM